MASTIYLSASRSHRPPVLRFAAHVFMSRNISLIFLHNADLGVFSRSALSEVHVVYVDCSLRLLAVRGPAKFCSKALQISSTMGPKAMKNEAEIRPKS